jgi:hypothetical protein
MNLNFGGTATTAANAATAANATTAAPFRFTGATPKVRALLFSSVVDSVVDPVTVSGSGGIGSGFNGVPGSVSGSGCIQT